MKVFFSLVTLLLILVSVRAQDNHSAPLTSIVQQISNSWLNVEAANKTGIKLESVEASFSLSKTTSMGGEIKIWIFKIGRKVDKTKISKVTLELNKADDAKKAGGIKKEATELTKFINATLANFKELNEANLLPDLPNRKITIEIGLTITKDHNAGGSYEIGIFSLSAEGGRKSEQGHTLKLVFSKIK